MNFKPLERFLREDVPMLGIPSSDTVIYRNHEEIFRFTYGYDDLRTGEPARADALYNMYSITKLATVTAGMQLLEGGEIMLNEPLFAYIPEYRDIRVKCEEGTRPASSPILLGHLFSMTAGFSYNVSSPYIKSVIERTDGRAPTLDIVRAFAEEPLDFDPGADFKYSFCHDVLGAVIEIVSGMTLGEYMKKNIFDPLGMKNTGFARTEDRLAGLTAQYSYDSKSDEIKEMDKTKCVFVFGSEYESGGAGLISTVDDQILLADALAMGGVGKSGERILSRFAIDLMRTNHLGEKALHSFRSALPHMASYGYGLGVRTNMEPKLTGNLSPVGEFGWDGAMASLILADPANGISMFHAEHVSGFGSHMLVHPKLRNLLYGCIGE